MTDIDWQKAIDDHIQEHLQLKKFEPNVFRASSLSGCVRECVRSRNGLITLNKEHLRYMHMGTIIHRFMQQDVALGSIGRPCEFEKAVSMKKDGITITGHIDAWDGSVIFDFKSTGSMERTLSYPTKKGYIYQVSFYAHAMNAKRAVLVYIDKSTLEVVQKEIEIMPLDEIFEFCRKVSIAEEIYQKTGELFSKDDCYPCHIEVEA